MSLLALGGYTMYSLIHMVYFRNDNQSPRARHVRLTVLETRNHLHTPAIGGLTLMDNGCKHGHLESRTHGTHAAPSAATIPFQSQFNTSTFYASFPAAVLTNGWALTTSYSHDAGVCNHSCVWYDQMIRVTWLIHICDMTYSQAGEAVMSVRVCVCAFPALVLTNGISLTRGCVNTYIHVYMYTYIHVYIYTYIHIYIYTYIYIYIYTYIHIYQSTHLPPPTCNRWCHTHTTQAATRSGTWCTSADLPWRTPSPSPTVWFTILGAPLPRLKRWRQFSSARRWCQIIDILTYIHTYIHVYIYTQTRVCIYI